MLHYRLLGPLEVVDDDGRRVDVDALAATLQGSHMLARRAREMAAVTHDIRG